MRYKKQYIACLIMLSCIFFVNVCYAGNLNLLTSLNMAGFEGPSTRYSTFSERASTGLATGYQGSNINAFVSMDVPLELRNGQIRRRFWKSMEEFTGIKEIRKEYLSSVQEARDTYSRYRESAPGHISRFATDVIGRLGDPIISIAGLLLPFISRKYKTFIVVGSVASLMVSIYSVQGPTETLKVVYGDDFRFGLDEYFFRMLAILSLSHFLFLVRKAVKYLKPSVIAFWNIGGFFDDWQKNHHGINFLKIRKYSLMTFKSKRERIAFIGMIAGLSIMMLQIFLFSLGRRHDVDDFPRCLMEACNGEFLNETVFWLSLCGAIISGSIAFAWETLYTPILSWIETGDGIHFKEKISGENILKNRINSIRVQSLSIRKCCDYILQNLVENAEQEKQLDLIYNVKNIKEKVFQLDDVMRDLEETCVFLIDSIIQAIEKKENPLSEENKNIIIRSKQIFTSSINDLMNDINFVRKFDEFRDTHFLLMGDSTKILGHASIILDDMNAILGNGSC